MKKNAHHSDEREYRRKNIFKKILTGALFCMILLLFGAAAAVVGPGGDHTITTISTTYTGTDGTTVTILGMQNAYGTDYCAVYCIEKDVPPGFVYNTSIDESHKGWGDDYSDQVMWIIQNGYSGTLSGGVLSYFANGYGLTPEDAYIATQLAIWHFTDGYDPPDLTGGMLEMYNYLVSDALANAEPYDPLAVYGDPDMDIGFNWDGGYDGEYIGPLVLRAEAHTNIPYGNYIWNSAIPVTVKGSGGNYLYDKDKYPVPGNSAIMHDGDEFYVYVGSNLSSGSLQLVSAEAKIDYTIDNEGFYFWCPLGTGVQAICGWGSYRVRDESSYFASTVYSATVICIEGNKEITGAPSSSKSFGFTLTECNSSYVPIDGLVSTTIGNGGGFSFAPILIGPHQLWELPLYFIIQEIDDGDGDWSFSGDVKRVKVDHNSGAPVYTYLDGQTFTNTWQGGPAPTGNLIIEKQLAGAYGDWGVTSTTGFQARIKDVTNNNYIKLTGVAPDYNYNGADSTGSLVTFRSGQNIQIRGLPANVTYQVMETSGAHYSTGYTGNSVLLGPDQTKTVEVINTYDHGAGVLNISKRLAGNYQDWGVDNDTVFTFEIKDVDAGNYLLFKSAPEPDGSYHCVGNSAEGLSEPYGGTPIRKIPFSAGQPVTVSNLWPERVYLVEETDGAHYTASYIGNSASFHDDGSATVTVVNTYIHGTGELVVTKSLAGSYDEFDADNSTEFKVKIYDVTAGNHLLFKDTPETDGSFRCVGNDVGGLSEEYYGNTISELTISEGQPLYLSNLWANTKYRVEETGGSNYTASYIGNDAMLPGSGQETEDNITIQVINTYSKDETTDSVKPPKPTVDPTRPPPDPDPEPTDPPPQPPPVIVNPVNPDPDPDPDDRESGDQNNIRQPHIPGGNDRYIPPNPTVPGRALIESEDGVFVEFDDETGVPLGEWRWDDAALEWIYNEYPPLGELPQTGTDSFASLYIFILGLTFISVGITMRIKTRKQRAASPARGFRG